MIEWYICVKTISKLNVLGESDKKKLVAGEDSNKVASHLGGGEGWRGGGGRKEALLLVPFS